MLVQLSFTTKWESKMIVYTKPNCPQCIQLKQHLDSKSIPYKTIEIDFGQYTMNDLISISEFKAKYPTVQQMPFWVSDDNQGGLQLAKRLF